MPLGGWVLSLEKLTRLEIHPGYAIAGAGVLLRDLHAAAQRSRPVLSARSHRDFGLHRRHHRHQRQRLAQLPLRRHAPLGGAAARGAGRWPPAGCRPRRRHRFRPRRRLPLPAVTKNTAGYLLRPGMDWIDLFVGSEGTLGVVTEARLRLLPLPKAILAGVVFFRDDDAAPSTPWTRWRAGGRRRACWSTSTRPRSACCARASPRFPAAARAALLVEQELDSEDDPEVDRWLDRIEAAGALAEDSWFATSAADRERFRRFRHACRSWSTKPCAAWDR